MVDILDRTLFLACAQSVTRNGLPHSGVTFEIRISHAVCGNPTSLERIALQAIVGIATRI